MPIDTINERRALLGLGPAPDGSLANSLDRRQLDGLFPLSGVTVPSTAPTRINLGTLRNDVLYRLGDTARSVWTEAEINQYIRQGYDELVFTTGALWVKREPAELQDVAGQGTYTLPTDLIKTERITWDYQRIEPLKQVELEHSDPRYRTTQGDVFGYLQEQDGLRTLRKVRVPNQDDAGLVSIEYWRRGLFLTGDTNELELPLHYAKYVRHYAMWKALEREGAGQDLKLAEHYQARYAAGVQRMLRRKNAVKSQRVGRMGGPYPAQTRMARPSMPWQYGQVVR